MRKIVYKVEWVLNINVLFWHTDFFFIKISEIFWSLLHQGFQFWAPTTSPVHILNNYLPWSSHSKYWRRPQIRISNSGWISSYPWTHCYPQPSVRPFLDGSSFDSTAAVLESDALFLPRTLHLNWVPRPGNKRNLQGSSQDHWCPTKIGPSDKYYQLLYQVQESSGILPALACELGDDWLPS